ncbi:MAG: phosphonate ABC transporter, permease protein PhnE [Tenericutes bacterium HGW-Tenericutes-3]|nr:MAG: phosphonate ABC transporter, permease protein PhnE [Tenericutes bacterium HGW-Tenericutes-3]
MGRSFTLPNGKVVVKPKSKLWIPLSIFLVLFTGFWFFIDFKASDINISQFDDILKQMFSPYSAGGIQETWKDYFSYSRVLVEPLMDTMKMSFAGTIIGTLAAFPFSVLASVNITKNPWIYQPFKFFSNLIRTIPLMVVALIAVLFVGTGILSGIMAITFFSFSIMIKMLYEVIETVDMGPNEALEACGGNKVTAFRYAIFPQIVTTYIGYIVYIFEINIRSSAILGYVGAGGIGSVLKDNVLYRYDRVGLIIIVLVVLFSIIQIITNLIKSKLV